MKKSERNWTAFAFVSLPAFPFAACQHRNVAQEFFSHFWTKNIQFCWNFSRFRGEKNIKKSKFCCAPSPDCTVGQFTVGGRSGTFQQTCKSFPHAQTTWLYALQTVRVETNSATWIILFKGRHGRLDLRAQTDHQRNWGRVFLQPQDSLLLAPPSPSAFFLRVKTVFCCERAWNEKLKSNCLSVQVSVWIWSIDLVFESCFRLDFYETYTFLESKK